MGKLSEDIFVCLDCESTGLDTKADSIIEIAAIKFTFSGIIAEQQTLVNPGCEPYTETVSVQRPGQRIIIRKRLQIRPAYLKLVNDQNAMVFVDGKFRGRTPLEKPVERRWEEQVSTKSVLVSLTKEGFEPFNQRLKLTAGETRPLQVRIEPKK